MDNSWGTSENSKHSKKRETTTDAGEQLNDSEWNFEIFTRRDLRHVSPPSALLTRLQQVYRKVNLYSPAALAVVQHSDWLVQLDSAQRNRHREPRAAAGSTERPTE